MHYIDGDDTVVGSFVSHNIGSGCRDTFELISVKVDCIEVVNSSDDFQLKSLENIRPIDRIGEYRKEDGYKPPCFTSSEDVRLDMSKYSIVGGLGIVYTGMPGCGKTWRAKDINNANGNGLVGLSLSCASVLQLKNNDFDKAYTFASYLNPNDTVQQHVNKLANEAFVIIDEYSMTTLRYWEILYRAYLQNKDLKLYFFGDESQCSAPDGKTFDIIHSGIVKHMCSDIIRLEYRCESGRYGPRLLKVLKEFDHTGKLKYKFPPPRHPLQRNITYLNNTRRKVNALCSEKYNQDGVDMMFKYQGKTEGPYKIYVGLEMLCKANLHRYGMVNNQLYVIQDMTERGITINDVELDILLFTTSFVPSYAGTVYTYQGLTINGQYCINDAKFMNRNQLYTALSRATCIDDICIAGGVRRYYEKEKISTTATYKKCHVSMFDKGKLYEISVCRDGTTLYYVGSTCNKIKHRLKEHLSDASSAVYPYRGLKPKIKLLTDWKCRTLRELELKEREFINEYVRRYGRKNVLNRKLIDDIEAHLEGRVDTAVVFKVKKIVVHDKGNQYRCRVNGKQYKVRYGKRNTKAAAKVIMEDTIKRNYGFGDKIVVSFE